MRRRRRSWIVRALLLLVLGYLSAVLVLMIFEDDIVYAHGRIPDGDWTPDGIAHESVTFRARDGTRLHGWLLEHDRPQAVILLCHGNGVNVSHAGPEAHALRTGLAATVFVFDYRGYGRSEGEPDEAGVLLDGEAALSWLTDRLGIFPNDVVHLGRSLGGAVAAHLAATFGARGLILERTFPSLPEAAAHHYGWVPTHWLMRNRFDNIPHVRSFRGPLLQSHGDRDETIPLALATRLFDASVSRPKQLVVMGGVDHNSADSAEFVEARRRFIAALPKGDRDH